jgi:SAM-dependent methyltransferase
LGTGTGWNAALLAWRAGAGRVVSVEVDEGLVAAARERVDGVVVGDGAAGWPEGAPFDRVIATYAVNEVPWPWVAQTRPGGRIVTPWGRLGHVALTVAEDGRSASGWMQGLATFMPARGSDPERAWWQVRGEDPPREERPVKGDMLVTLRGNVHLLFALRIALPHVRITIATGGENGVTAWLHDGVASWAALVAPDDGDGESVAYLGGERDLLVEVERAWDGWRELGEPDLYDYGMTVEPDRQYVWCRDAGTGPRWPVVGSQISWPNLTDDGQSVADRTGI